MAAAVGQGAVLADPTIVINDGMHRDGLASKHSSQPVGYVYESTISNTDLKYLDAAPFSRVSSATVTCRCFWGI